MAPDRGHEAVDASRVRAGDRSYLSELVREYTGAVLRWVKPFANGPDDADDLVQEVWRRVVLRHESYRGTGSFRAWLYSVTRSVGLDGVRDAETRRRREGALLRDAAADPVEDLDRPLDRLDRQARYDRAREAMESLSPRQREVVRLRILDDFSVRETAAAMGCAEGTVKAAMSHALENLRTMLRSDASRRRSHDGA